jgi:hypothetical protein
MKVAAETAFGTKATLREEENQCANRSGVPAIS